MSAAPDPRPLPDVGHPDFAPYWAAAAAHRLVVMGCAGCHRRRWPPRPACPACGSTEAEWVEVAGTGSLYSWTTIGRAALPGFESDLPYTVAVVELDDQAAIRHLATLEAPAGLALRVGLPVRVGFRERSGVTLPVWRVVEADGGRA